MLMDHVRDGLTIGHLKLLVSAADGESFTFAAKEAGISPAAVSKMIRRLEQRLGVALFARTTRRMRLTDIGKHYVERCRTALGLLRDAEQVATGEQTIASGHLRVSVPGAYAYWRLLPKLARFRERYPNVSLTIQISDRPVGLTDEHVDIAIRGYAMEDSSLITRKIEDAELVVVASPAYLARVKAIALPDDLADQSCIQFRIPGNGRVAPWRFMQDGSPRDVETSGDIVLEDQYLAGVALAAGGAGLYQMYRFVVEDDLVSGRLVEVLSEHGGTTRPFHLLYAGGGTQPARLRAFIDFVVAELAIPSIAVPSRRPPRRAA